MLAPISWRVPPRHYGPWEQFVALLTDGLVDRGVEVTLFASGDSLTTARLVATSELSWGDDPGADRKVAECLHVSAVFERAHAGEFDLIHNSFDFLPLTYSALVDTPIVTTIHGFSSDRILPVYEKYNHAVGYIAISQANRHPRLDYLATIHHGIDIGAFEPGSGDGGYLLFFGRIHPDKGTASAIEVARRAGMPIVIAGIVHDERYFHECVARHIDGKNVRYVGPVTAHDRSAVLGGAAALLHLIEFDEPFGFSVVEAMACGTPVIASARGSMAELIEHGTTGYLVHSVSEAVAAVGRIATLDRGIIRLTATSRFGRDRMVNKYLAAYACMLEPSGTPGR